MATARSSVRALVDVVFGPRIFDVIVAMLVGAVLAMALSSERRDVSAAGAILTAATVFAVLRAIHWMSTDYDLPIPKWFAIVFIFAVIGSAWYGIHTWLESKLDVISWFSAEVRSAFVADSGPRTLYMVRYPSSFGETISPVIYLAYLKLVNNGDLPRSIESLKVEASKDESGPWEEIKSIPLPTVAILALTQNGSPSRITMQLGHETLRLGTVPDEKFLKHAVLSSLGPFLLENELKTPLKPHIPVYGWIALDSYRHTGLSPGRIHFRITISEGGNPKTSSAVIELPRAGNRMDMQANCGFIEMTDAVLDVSGAHLKYYSDPFPSPEFLKR